MCHQDCTHNDNNTVGCQKVKRSGTPPGGCSSNPFPEITLNPNDMTGNQGSHTRIQNSSRITQRTSIEIHGLRHNRSDTPPGGCSSRHTNSATPSKSDDAIQRIDVKNLFQSCTGNTNIEKEDTALKLQNLGILELLDDVKSKTDCNSARSSVGINDCKNFKKDGFVLKCDNFSITQIIERLNIATETTSSVWDSSENKNDIPKDKVTLHKSQKRNILEIFEKAQNKKDKKLVPHTLNGLEYQEKSIFEIIETSQTSNANKSRLSPEDGNQNHNMSVPNIVTPKDTGRVIKHQNLSIGQIIENAQNRKDNKSSSSHSSRQNTRIVELFDKLDNSTTPPSRHYLPTCSNSQKVSLSKCRSSGNRKSSLKHQNLSINEIFQNAQRNRDIHLAHLHSKSQTVEKDENSNHLTMNEIVRRLKSSGDKLQSSMCQGVSFPADKKRIQNNYKSNSRLSQSVSSNMDSRQSLNSNKIPSKFSLGKESRGQTRDCNSISSYPIPLPYKTGSDYEKPCMFQVIFPEPSQLPLPPPSFLQSRPKPTAIPRHMRRAMKSRFQ